MSVIIISHRKDLDGLSSAALMVRYFTKHRPLPYYLTLRDYPDGPDIIEQKLMHIKDSEIYIADLATDQKFIDEVFSRLKKLKEKNNKIVWMDHHPARPDIARTLRSLIDKLVLKKSTMTGSEIVYSTLYKANKIDDKHAELLSRLGHDSDLMEMKIPITRKLVTLIDYYNYLDSGSTLYPNLVQLVLSLAMPKKEADINYILTEDNEQQIKRYQKLLDEGKKKVFSNIEVIPVGKYRFAIFRYPTIFSGTRISAEVLSAFDVDASVGYSDDGSGSVRRNNDAISCRQIAKLLGGGGHEFAAGFSLGFEITGKDEDRRAREIIKEAIKRVYS